MSPRATQCPCTTSLGTRGGEEGRCGSERVGEEITGRRHVLCQDRVDVPPESEDFPEGRGDTGHDRCKVGRRSCRESVKVVLLRDKSSEGTEGKSSCLCFSGYREPGETGGGREDEGEGVGDWRKTRVLYGL